MPWHDETLWFVPDERHAELLVREGVMRGRAWTAEELGRVVLVASAEEIRAIALVKMAVDGDVAAVRREHAARRAAANTRAS